MWRSLVRCVAPVFLFKRTNLLDARQFSPPYILHKDSPLLLLQKRNDEVCTSMRLTEESDAEYFRIKCFIAKNHIYLEIKPKTEKILVV